jgi:putative flippase GtrA
MNSRNPAASVTVARIGRYGLTGGAAAVVDVGVFIVLTAQGLFTPAAAAGAFCVAALVNYGLTSRFVFRQKLALRRLGTFLAFALVGLGVNVGVTSAGVMIVNLPAMAAKIGGIGVAFLVNFWLNNTIVFRSQART